MRCSEVGKAHVMRTPVLAPDVANLVNAGVSFAPQYLDGHDE
jgi:hypothetical protein